MKHFTRQRAPFRTITGALAGLLLPFSVSATGPGSPKELSPTIDPCYAALHHELDNNPHRMQKGRNLPDYISDSFSGAPFQELLKALPEKYLIIENGPGLARAAIDILNSPELSKSGSILLVDRVKPEDPILNAALVKYGPRMKFASGKTIEQSYADGDLDAYLNQADLAIGSYASESYVPDVNDTIEKNLHLLKTGASYIFNIVWMGVGRTSRLMTTFRPANQQGEEGDNYTVPRDTFCKWLQQISGAKVKHCADAGFNETSYIVILERTTGDIVLPPLERREYNPKYAPPRRVYIAPTVTIPKDP